MPDQTELIQSDIDAYLEQHQNKEIVRFLTCGSVDDGKSTMIGRLLHDSKVVYDDQLEAIREASSRNGIRAEELDLSLLVDGLQAEREQGITIDVAYRYFSTSKRKFIIADCPGHEQYTRNMATGASTCDLAIILIDAQNGILNQTKRHTVIAHLLGIQHIIVAVNKMDLVGYREGVFTAIQDEFTTFASLMSIEDLTFVPISARYGDNVVSPSTNMPWFRGATLLHSLDNIHVANDLDYTHFRMPVQRVNRPDDSFRGYSGTIKAGLIHPGERVVALPSGKTTIIDRIVTMDGDLPAAFPPMSVTLTLTDEIDLSRGDTLVAEEEPPHVTDRFSANIVWMHESALRGGAQYIFKHESAQVPGRIDQIQYRTDITSLLHEDADHLGLNEVGRCEVVLTSPIVFDDYAKNRSLGSVIIIDRISNLTVGAGMIVNARHPTRGSAWDVQPSETLRKSGSRVSVRERADRFNQVPVTVLFTGMSKVGKTTIAREVEHRLFQRGHMASIVDGQSFRLGMSRDLGFSHEDRSENVRRGAEAARLMCDAGLICLMTFVAPIEDDRNRAREVIGSDRFLEVFMTAPVDVLKSRDELGLFDAAQRGDLASFPGVNEEFDQPAAPDLILHTDGASIDDCTTKVIELLRSRRFIV